MKKNHLVYFTTLSSILTFEQINKNRHFTAYFWKFFKNQKYSSILLILKIIFLIKKQRKQLFLGNFKVSVLIHRYLQIKTTQDNLKSVRLDKGKWVFYFCAVTTDNQFCREKQRRNNKRAKSCSSNDQKVQVASVHWFANERNFLLPIHFFRPPWTRERKKVI